MAKDPLTTAVNKAEPQPTTTPRVRPSEFGIENRGMSRAAALAEDQDDYFNEGIGRRNRATPAFKKGGKVMATRNYCKGGKVISSKNM